MGRINSTYSGGYYHAPDLDVFPLLHQNKVTPPKPTHRKMTHMLELTLQCDQCTRYISRMTKVNALVHSTNQKYHGVSIYELTFKCPDCACPITLNTDPQSRGYVVKSNAKCLDGPWQDQMRLTREAEEKKVNEAIHGGSKESITTRLEKIQQLQEDTDALHELYWHIRAKDKEAERRLSMESQMVERNDTNDEQEQETIEEQAKEVGLIKEQGTPEKNEPLEENQTTHDFFARLQNHEVETSAQQSFSFFSCLTPDRKQELSPQEDLSRKEKNSVEDIVSVGKGFLESNLAERNHEVVPLCAEYESE